MTYDEILERCYKGFYFRDDLYADLKTFANSVGVENEAGIKQCFSIAYDLGHSCGASEVLNYFDDLLEICKAYEQ